MLIIDVHTYTQLLHTVDHFPVKNVVWYMSNTALCKHYHPEKKYLLFITTHYHTCTHIQTFLKTINICTLSLLLITRTNLAILAANV